LSESDIARSPRADAQRNRERLLATALKLFTSSKKEVTLSAVAERAGVGIGTLYRLFPLATPWSRRFTAMRLSG
jgi:AcrR family transcriptional regulator